MTTNGTLLGGLRVLEITNTMTGAQVGQLLGDFGADVVMVERPGGSALRSAPAFPFWARGKRSVEMDLDQSAGRKQMERLLAEADVLVETLRPATRARFGLSADGLGSRHSHLIHASVTGFGPAGPLAEAKGYEGLVMAKTGGMSAFSGMVTRPGPAFVSAPYASWAAAQAALHGILAALFERERSGAGQHVEVSLAQSVAALDPWGWMVHWLTSQYPDSFTAAPPVGDDLVPNSSFTFRLLVALTKDGRWLQFSQVQPRLFRAMMRALELDWMFDGPKWQSAPEFADPAQRVEFWDILLDTARQKSTAEWQEVFASDHDVWAEIFRRGSELLHHPQMIHNRMVATIPDRDGRPILQPGRLVRVFGEDDFSPPAAPAAGEANDELLGPAGASTTRPRKLPRGGLPLEGVTVLELGTFYAAPFGATLLTDFGARVIKIEPLEGDPMRIMQAFPESGAARVLQGKESVALDIASDEGREIIYELARRSDLVLQCFRAGVAERLKVDSESLRAVNPDLVYVNAPGYGIDGPNGHCPAFAPTMGAGAGFAWRNAGSAVPDGSDLDTLEIKRNSLRLTAAAGPQFAQADGVSAVVVATGLLLGLVGRARGAGARTLMTTMLSSCAHALSEDMVEYDGRAALPLPDPEFLGLGSLYRLYEAADGWVFLAAPKESDFPALARALQEYADLSGPEFATARSRHEHQSALADRLAEAFRSRPAAEWEQTMLAADVGCVAVAPAPPEGNYLSSFGRENGYVADVVHPTFGEHPRLAPLVHFSRSTVQALPGTMLGQHTASVLHEIGIDDERLVELAARNVILTG